ncbi:MAG: T9SS type A sorting domain-containing protein, partial [Candidatus Marinimicrobia bacterium]|nr:T9SS type A sorting domain-containing protein [Candidatus Neomarinimicrobiota bacterium]
GLAIKFFSTETSMGIVEDLTPTKFSLMQNYPNPFNPSTTIQYHLNQQGTVNVSVYNLSGQKIRQLVDSNQDPGQHSVSWDGKDEKGIAVGSGMYFYRLNVHSAFAGTRDGLSKTGKMVLLR